MNGFFIVQTAWYNIGKTFSHALFDKSVNNHTQEGCEATRKLCIRGYLKLLPWMWLKHLNYLLITSKMTRLQMKTKWCSFYNQQCYFTLGEKGRELHQKNANAGICGTGTEWMTDATNRSDLHTEQTKSDLPETVTILTWGCCCDEQMNRNAKLLTESVSWELNLLQPFPSVS